MGDGLMPGCCDVLKNLVWVVEKRGCFKVCKEGLLNNTPLTPDFYYQQTNVEFVSND